MKKLLLSTLALSATMAFAQKLELVKNINLESGRGSYPYQLTQLRDDIIVFSAEDTVVGKELFISDGTKAGTKVLKNINPGNNSSYPYFLYKAADNRVYFQAEVDTLGYELFVTDGTEAGTVLVKDINPGVNGSNPSNFIDYKGKVFFTANVDTLGYCIFSTNGTAAGTELIKVINGLNYSNINLMKVYNNLLFFNAQVDSVGNELFVTDGTAAGTRLVKDFDPGTNGSYPFFYAEFDNKLLFVAHNNNFGNKLWVTDGTEAGTKKYYDFYPGTSSNFNDVVVFDNKLILNVNGELWVMDGTLENTRVLSYAVENPAYFTEFNGKLYFSADNTYGRRSLYVTDGTSQGTKEVIDSKPTPAAFTPDVAVGFLKAFKDKLYFSNYEPNSLDTEYPIMFSNGTYNNQTPIFDEVGAELQYGYEFAYINSDEVLITDNIMYLAMEINNFGKELYKITNVGVVSINEPIAAKSTLNVYPNPATDIINIETEALEAAYNVSVIDLTGRAIISNEMNFVDGLNTVQLNVEGLNSGVYFVKIGNQPAQKFIKK